MGLATDNAARLAEESIQELRVVANGWLGDECPDTRIDGMSLLRVADALDGDDLKELQEAMGLDTIVRDAISNSTYSLIAQLDGFG